MDDLSYGSFSLNFKDGSDIWFLAVHPEMAPAKTGIKPLGSYFVYCIHPTRGSLTFIVEQDENCRWFCERKPPFISDAFVEWIGSEIESHSK